MVGVRLYHYTCDHGRQGIGDTGVLVSAATQAGRDDLLFPALVVWLTDMATPDRNALGLTSNILSCDRTRYRYRVTDATTAIPWTQYARLVPRWVREELEGAPGTRPVHWWISLTSVPVEIADAARWTA